jgi:hypothetical protein
LGAAWKIEPAHLRFFPKRNRKSVCAFSKKMDLAGGASLKPFDVLYERGDATEAISSSPFNTRRRPPAIAESAWRAWQSADWQAL